MTAEEKLKELVAKIAKRVKGKREEQRENIPPPFYPGPGAFDWRSPRGGPSPGAGGRSDPWA